MGGGSSGESLSMYSNTLPPPPHLQANAAQPAGGRASGAAGNGGGRGARGGAGASSGCSGRPAAQVGAAAGGLRPWGSSGARPRPACGALHPCCTPSAAPLNRHLSPELWVMHRTCRQAAFSDALEQELELYGRCSSSVVYQNLAARESAVEWRRRRRRREQDLEQQQEQQEQQQRREKSERQEQRGQGGQREQQQARETRDSQQQQGTVQRGKQQRKRPRAQLLQEAELDWLGDGEGIETNDGEV